MGLRNYLTLRKGKVKGFTLLESLIALVVISGSLLLFQAMSRLLISEVRYQKSHEQKEWLLFVDQLEAELDGSHYQKSGNQSYLSETRWQRYLYWEI